MNSDQIKGKWKQLKGVAKERWGKLTDDDLNVIDGQSDQLIGKIQERYGIARNAAQKQVEEWNSGLLREDDVQDRRRAS
ncbi:MAG: CsbD family protein [Terriglobales bacterium]